MSNDLTERRKHEQEMLEAARAAMSRKLTENTHKESWRERSVGWLLGRLREEVRELELEINEDGTSWEAVINEAADVANFAGMIIDVIHERTGIERPPAENERWRDRIQKLERRASCAIRVLRGRE